VTKKSVCSEGSDEITQKRKRIGVLKRLMFEMYNETILFSLNVHFQPWRLLFYRPEALFKVSFFASQL